MVFTFFHVIHIINTFAVVILSFLSSLAHLLLHFFLLSHLTGKHILFVPVLMLLILAGLLLLHGLEAHPFLVAVCATLIDHLLFDILAPVELSHVRDLLSLVDLLLHEPVIHGLSPVLVLLPLLFRYSQQLFFDLVLRLTDKFASEAFLSILGLKPVLIAQTLAFEFLSAIQILSRTCC